MKNAPKVSIILPTYNGECYISESIDSIRNQSFPDWELIIVNDCSNDSTPEIIARYAEIDSRIRVIHNAENMKLPASLNIGMRDSRGIYVTWTSDDNRYKADAICKMVEYLDQHPEYVMVCADMAAIDENGNITGSYPPYEEEYMYYNDCVGACFLYKREVMDAVGEYDVNKFLIEDYDYWLRILRYYGHIGHLEEDLYEYRRHSGSLTGQRALDIRKQLLKERREHLPEILEKLKNNKRLITIMYLEFWESDPNPQDILKEFLVYVPELGVIKDINPQKNYIVYGAGQLGDKAYEQLGEQIIKYTDSNNSLFGSYKNEIEIISVSDAIAMSDSIQIVVAAGLWTAADIILHLSELGVAECAVFPGRRGIL